MMVRKAVVLAAGLASRLMPATKAVSKPMLPIVDKPTIQYVIEELQDSGIEEVAVIVNKNDSLVKKHFSEHPELKSIVQEAEKHHLLEEFERIENLAKLTFIEQEKPFGAGHALLQAKNFLNEEPFVLVYADDVFLSKTPATKQLLESFEKCKCSIISASEVPMKEVVHFGVIKVEERKNPMKVVEIVEKPSLEKAPSNLAMPGRYVLMPEFFDVLESKHYSVKNELFVSPELNAFAKEGKLFAHELEGKWFTTGKKLDYVKTIVSFALQRPDLKEELEEFLRELVK